MSKRSSRTLAIVWIAFVGAASARIGAAAPRRQVTSQCLPADGRAAGLIAIFKNIIKSTDARDIALRDDVGLTGVDTSGIAVVTDTAICARAAAAIDQLANGKNSGRLVYVLRAGSSHFIVEDPHATAGEYVSVAVFDSQFKLVRMLLI
jgi:hypothetical protein